MFNDMFNRKYKRAISILNGEIFAYEMVLNRDRNRLHKLKETGGDESEYQMYLDEIARYEERLFALKDLRAKYVLYVH